MAVFVTKSGQPRLNSEIGTIRKHWRGRVSVVLAYPNRYHVGMSNLGFHTLYRLLNQYEHVVCERAFLPENQHVTLPRLTTLESDRPVAHADIIAFSVSFENDYPNLLTILDRAEIPLRSRDRGDRSPLVIAGGVTCFLNPEPIAAFIDCFLIGEAEGMVPQFFEFYDRAIDKHTNLKNLAQNVPGAYVPAFFRPRYQNNGTLAAFETLEDVAPTVERVYVKDLSQMPTCSAIVTPDTIFSQSYLIEVGRGCPHGCRFCSAGFIYRPPRFRPISLLEQNMTHGLEMTENIGLVGAAVSDLPHIEKLCANFEQKDSRISFSSLRADRLTPELLRALKKGKVKTATVAPEVGSERMRKVVNKGISAEDILQAAATLVENGIPNLKLYFMIGLPTETEADIEAIIKLCKQIKHRFLSSSRARKHIGQITVSLNSFVPKPFTPFQWVAMDEIRQLKTKIKKIKNELKKVPNVRLNVDVPRWAYIQALFSRGDRRVADILLMAHSKKGNWVQTLKTVPINPDFYVLRERKLEELFPWDFIDHGIKKSYLKQEYQRALNARSTPVCRVETCSVCGVCAAKSVSE